MRSTRPMTGAETTNRSRTRVSPSSSIVTCIGPRSTLATSISMALGHSATARMATTIVTTASNRGLFGIAHGLLPHLQHRHEIEPVQLPPDEQRGNRRGGDDAEEGPGHRLP